MRENWKTALSEHQRQIAEQLSKAGIESPKELIKRVEWLRAEVKKIKGEENNRLNLLLREIDAAQEQRDGLLARLDKVNREITARRQHKAEELTQILAGELRISVAPCADRSRYLKVLLEICRRDL